MLDPSMAVEKRTQTVTPLQALALLNNQLAVVMAGHFAARVEKAGGNRADQLRDAFQLAIGRAPDDGELRTLADYAEQHGMPNACRLIFNLNEFVFVD